MSTARFLLALACCCTSATFAAADGSVAELELQLARTPSLYLRLDARSGVVQVMARGLELDRVQAVSVRTVVRRSAGQAHAVPAPDVPAVWQVSSPPAVSWRKVIAPGTLVPYQEGSAPASSLPSPTPQPELPTQYQVELDSGWILHLGNDPPDRWQRRLATRFGSGWRRLTGRAAAPPPPALIVVTEPEDSRRLLHLLVEGTPLILFCGDADRPPEQGSSPSASRPSASTVGTLP